MARQPECKDLPLSQDHHPGPAAIVLPEKSYLPVAMVQSAHNWCGDGAARISGRY
jgi:hypothetical protein